MIELDPLTYSLLIKAASKPPEVIKMEWITDRKPTAEDADQNGSVLITDIQGIVRTVSYMGVDNLPWQPLPEPYEPPEPRKFWIELNEDGTGTAYPRDDTSSPPSNNSIPVIEVQL